MKKQGISLIVLVITIVVIIILAAAVILALGQNNPISSSRIASVAQTKDSIESSIVIYSSNVQAKTLGELSVEKILTDSEYKIISDATPKTVTKNGIVTSLYVIDYALAKSKMNLEIKNEGNGVWCVDKYGKAYLVYENIDSVSSYFKDEENISSSVSNFVTIDGGIIITSEITYAEYKLGDAVTIKVDGVDETFFVIADSPKTESTVTLITKENIDISTLRQSTSATRIQFYGNGETVGYWWDNTNQRLLDKYGTSEGLNVDIGSIQSTEQKHALYAAQEYGKKLGGTGRLLLKSEANDLSSSNSALLCANSGIYKSANDYLVYWLSTPETGAGGVIWVVYSNGTNFAGVTNTMFWYTNSYGIRPVVTIAKSKI